MKNTIQELEKLGYQFELKGDSLSFHYMKAVSPSYEVVNPLLNKLRQNKADAIVFLRERAFRQVQIRLEYNKLLEREQKAEIWMDNPRRTDEEVTKWMPLFNEILVGLNRLIGEIGLQNSSELERVNGFDISGLLGNEISLGELPEEWRAEIDRDTLAKATVNF